MTKRELQIALRAAGRVSGQREFILIGSKPLWKCPACGRAFANRNQSHACGKLDLDHHFTNKPREVRLLFDQFVRAVRVLGPVVVLPEKTRIAFQTRMSFAQVTPRKSWLAGHLVLARRVGSARFHKIETISPRNHVHHFRIGSGNELDPEFLAYLAEAYSVGNQEHLQVRPILRGKSK